MTRKQWAKLSDDERRAKVAILRGYKFHPENRRMKWSRDESRISGGVFSVAPPDYLNDLNAMHEAIRVLSPKQLLYYRNVLIGMHGLTNDWAAIDATAAQRAEAFVLTMEMEEE